MHPRHTQERALLPVSGLSLVFHCSFQRSVGPGQGRLLQEFGSLLGFLPIRFFSAIGGPQIEAMRCVLSSGWPGHSLSVLTLGSALVAVGAAPGSEPDACTPELSLCVAACFTAPLTSLPRGGGAPSPVLSGPSVAPTKQINSREVSEPGLWW